MRFLDFVTQTRGRLYSNGEVCCILGVCCAPDAAVASLSREMQKAGVDPAHADKAAAYVLGTWDLAPAGSLAAFKAGIRTAVETHLSHPPAA